MRIILCVLLLFLSVALPSSALDAKNVFLLVNKNEPKSRQVADHYCNLRKVPSTNIIELDLPVVEDITRDDYEAKLVRPLRTALRTRRLDAKVLLSTYGVPLRVGPQVPTEKEREQISGIRADIAEKRKQMELKEKTAKALEEDAKNIDLPSLQARANDLKKEAADIQKHVQELENTARRLGHEESNAAVDSELMQLWWPEYPKDRWVLNPLNWQMPEAVRRQIPPVVMTCRLDGPTADVAKRLVTDAVWAEENGLKGKAYIDARGIPYDAKSDSSGTGYGGYDESMRETAELLKTDAKMDVKLDNIELLFDRNSCTDTAIYCGWYSVRNYIPCCKFNRGAIAWHLASFEMVSLRDPQTQWCGNLLMDGACATIGPVAEPYAVAFPKPAEFFGFISSGEYTLVEAYSRTVILNSWMMCLVGDPLYNPYKKDPRMPSSMVKPSPKGSRFLVGP